MASVMLRFSNQARFAIGLSYRCGAFYEESILGTPATSPCTRHTFRNLDQPSWRASSTGAAAFPLGTSLSVPIINRVSGCFRLQTLSLLRRAPGIGISLCSESLTLKPQCFLPARGKPTPEHQGPSIPHASIPDRAGRALGPHRSPVSCNRRQQQMFRLSFEEYTVGSSTSYFGSGGITSSVSTLQEAFSVAHVCLLLSGRHILYHARPDGIGRCRPLQSHQQTSCMNSSVTSLPWAAASIALRFSASCM